MPSPDPTGLVTTNNSVGIIDNLFGSKADSFYEAFYNSFLTTANSLPINSLWVLYIEQVPIKAINFYTSFREGWNVEKSLILAAQEADSSYRKKGMVIAQGVKNIGESITVERTGSPNNGFIQGIVGKGRAGFPLLNVSFMENNLSFTDYVLRPWMIAVSHASLKEFTLKTNIHVWFLSKTGSRSDLARRKIISYYDCCPVSIDEEEYNYTGSDVLKQRQVQFAYSHYNMTDGDAALLSLLNYSGTTKGMFGTLTDRLKSELQRQFGANNPQQYINNLIDKAKGFGQEIITGTATQIVTNVAGKLQGKVDAAITSVESNIRSGATKLVNSVNNMVNNALGESSHARSNGGTLPSSSLSQTVAAQVDTQRRIGANNASFGGYQAKTFNNNDTPVFIKKIEDLERGTPAVVDVNIPINQNDAPMTNGSIPFRQVTKTATNPNDDTVMLDTPLQYLITKSNPPMDDVRNGSINHQEVEKKINQGDYVSSLHLNQSDKQTEQNDIPNHNSIKYTVKTINQDDTPIYKKNT